MNPRFLLRLRLRPKPVPTAVPDGPAEAVIETTEPQISTPPNQHGFALLLATAAGAGYAPIAPGTFGSAVGVLLYWIVADLGGFLFGVTLLSLAFLGIWASDIAERVFARKDDGRIVIDEVVGQLLTLAPLAVLAPEGGRRSWPWLLAGFLLFRLLDIWKPPPIGWDERSFAGGTGVMMDDIFAGIIGGLLMSIALLRMGP